MNSKTYSKTNDSKRSKLDVSSVTLQRVNSIFTSARGVNKSPVGPTGNIVVPVDKPMVGPTGNIVVPVEKSQVGPTGNIVIPVEKSTVGPTGNIDIPINKPHVGPTGNIDIPINKYTVGPTGNIDIPINKTPVGHTGCVVPPIVPINIESPTQFITQAIAAKIDVEKLFTIDEPIVKSEPKVEDKPISFWKKIWNYYFVKENKYN